MMNIWHDIAPERIKSDDFVACIEISKGGKNKYEMDKETGMLKLDRVLYTSTHYPANYGFIPRTYADDNDPLDVLVLCSEAILPMTLVKCYPIGVIKMIDSQSIDEKIIAIPDRDPNYNAYRDVNSLPAHTRRDNAFLQRIQNARGQGDDSQGALRARRCDRYSQQVHQGI